MPDVLHLPIVSPIRRTMTLAIGVVALWSISAPLHAAPVKDALVYDATSHTPVPVPPSERSLQTVTAKPWVSLPDTGDLEGPVFEQDGSLIFSDVVGHRILRVLPDGKISTVVAQLPFGPGGLAIRQDGRIFIAAIDLAANEGAILSIRPDGSDLRTEIPPSAGFLPNDIVFDRQGGYYFTDFRGSATNPRGGVYYTAPDSRRTIAILPNLAMANGVALSPDGKELWTTEFGRNALYRVQLADATHVAALGTAMPYHFNGPAPDSMRIDADGNLYVALYGQGRVLAFGRNGVPIGQILLPERDAGHNLNTTNMAIKPGMNEIYIVASDRQTHSAGLFRSRVFGKGMQPYAKPSH